jgi:acetyltransferase-like isoleucine patch superfamily enzyme
LYIRTKVKYFRQVKFNGFTVYVAFKKSKIQIGKGSVINSRYVSNLLGLFQGTIIIARYGGIIKIGKNVGISGSTIYAMEKIVIGDNSLIGANCKIIDNDFHPLEADKRIDENPIDIRRKSVNIGKNCFIGMNSIILKGSVIGDNCIVGAGSVVSGVFPENSVIAGNPATIIKTNPSEKK